MKLPLSDVHIQVSAILPVSVAI